MSFCMDGELDVAGDIVCELGRRIECGIINTFEELQRDELYGYINDTHPCNRLPDVQGSVACNVVVVSFQPKDKLVDYYEKLLCHCAYKDNERYFKILLDMMTMEQALGACGRLMMSCDDDLVSDNVGCVLGEVIRRDDKGAYTLDILRLTSRMDVKETKRITNILFQTDRPNAEIVSFIEEHGSDLETNWRFIFSLLSFSLDSISPSLRQAVRGKALEQVFANNERSKSVLSLLMQLCEDEEARMLIKTIGDLSSASVHLVIPAAAEAILYFINKHTSLRSIFDSTMSFSNCETPLEYVLMLVLNHEQPTVCHYGFAALCCICLNLVNNFGKVEFSRPFVYSHILTIMNNVTTVKLQFCNEAINRFTDGTEPHYLMVHDTDLCKTIEKECDELLGIEHCGNEDMDKEVLLPDLFFTWTIKRETEAYRFHVEHQLSLTYLLLRYIVNKDNHPNTRPSRGLQMCVIAYKLLEDIIFSLLPTIIDGDAAHAFVSIMSQFKGIDTPTGLIILTKLAYRILEYVPQDGKFDLGFSLSFLGYLQNVLAKTNMILNHIKFKNLEDLVGRVSCLFVQHCSNEVFVESMAYLANECELLTPLVLRALTSKTDLAKNETMIECCLNRLAADCTQTKWVKLAIRTNDIQKHSSLPKLLQQQIKSMEMNEDLIFYHLCLIISCLCQDNLQTVTLDSHSYRGKYSPLLDAISKMLTSPGIGQLPLEHFSTYDPTLTTRLNNAYNIMSIRLAQKMVPNKLFDVLKELAFVIQASTLPEYLECLFSTIPLLSQGEIEELFRITLLLLKENPTITQLLVLSAKLISAIPPLVFVNIEGECLQSYRLLISHLYQKVSNAPFLFYEVMTPLIPQLVTLVDDFTMNILLNILALSPDSSFIYHSVSNYIMTENTPIVVSDICSSTDSLIYATMYIICKTYDNKPAQAKRAFILQLLASCLRGPSDKTVANIKNFDILSDNSKSMLQMQCQMSGLFNVLRLLRCLVSRDITIFEGQNPKDLCDLLIDMSNTITAAGCTRQLSEILGQAFSVMMHSVPLKDVIKVCSQQFDKGLKDGNERLLCSSTTLFSFYIGKGVDGISEDLIEFIQKIAPMLLSPSQTLQGQGIGVLHLVECVIPGVEKNEKLSHVFDLVHKVMDTTDVAKQISLMYLKTSPWITINGRLIFSHMSTAFVLYPYSSGSDIFHLATDATAETANEMKIKELTERQLKILDYTWPHFFSLNKQKKIESSKTRKWRESELIVCASLVDDISTLGSIARYCEIFGVKKLVVQDANCANSREFQQTSVSAEVWLDIESMGRANLAEYLVKMKRDYSIVAFSNSEQSAAYETDNVADYMFPKRTLLVLGNETDGIPFDIYIVSDACLTARTSPLPTAVCGICGVWEYTKQHIIRCI